MKKYTAVLKTLTGTFEIKTDTYSNACKWIVDKGVSMFSSKREAVVEGFVYKHEDYKKAKYYINKWNDISDNLNFEDTYITSCDGYRAVVDICSYNCLIYVNTYCIIN